MTWKRTEEDELTELFASLADPTRIKIVKLLCEQEEMAVGELCEALEKLQPNVSQHLSFLRRNRVVYARRVGQSVHYGLTNPALCQYLKPLYVCWIEGPDAAKRHLEEAKTRVKARKAS